MKAAAEFSDEYEWGNHQHTFKQHTRGAAKEHYHNERQKTKQKTVCCVLIEFPVIFGNGSCVQEPFHKD